MAYTENIRNAINDSEFKKQLEELIFLTERLRRHSVRIFMIILLAILSFASFTYLHSYLNRQLSLRNNEVDISSSYLEKYEFADFFSWAITLGILILGMFFLYQFFKIKKRGIIIYDELTDELDWGHKRKEFIKRPPIETRIIVKDFLQNTDLPFTDGQNGQIIYLVFFFLLVISTIIVKAI